jgi:hypothetical protein
MWRVESGIVPGYCTCTNSRDSIQYYNSACSYIPGDSRTSKFDVVRERSASALLSERAWSREPLLYCVIEGTQRSSRNTVGGDYIAHSKAKRFPSPHLPSNLSLPRTVQCRSFELRPELAKPALSWPREKPQQLFITEEVDRTSILRAIFNTLTSLAPFLNRACKLLSFSLASRKYVERD